MWSINQPLAEERVSRGYQSGISFICYSLHYRNIHKQIDPFPDEDRTQ
jgi:hypothetical protein